jgi:hypothetical protein
MSGRPNDGFNRVNLEPAIKNALERREISSPIPTSNVPTMYSVVTEKTQARNQPVFR